MKTQRAYLQDVLKRIPMIERFTSGGRKSFMESDMAQESVIRCYEVIGEIVKRLDAHLLALHPHIPWKSISGFRDVLIHNYDEIRLEVVWQAVEDDLPDLKRAVEALLASLPESDPGEPAT